MEEIPAANAHSMKVLELPAVLELIAAKCVNASAAEQIRRLHPLRDKEAVERSLALQDQMRDLILDQGDLPVPSTEMRARLEQVAQTGESLSGRELLALARFEQEVCLLREKLRSAKAGKLIIALARKLKLTGTLTEAVSMALDEEGSVRDGASPVLAQTRSGIRIKRQKLRREAEAMAKAYGRGCYVTVEGERYLLMVPRGRAGGEGGIVHGSSLTGKGLYFEPAALVAGNNELEVLLVQEREEEERILQRLTGLAVAAQDTIEATMRAVDQVDCLRARVLFSQQFHCHRPILDSGGSLKLVGARHPLLEISLQPKGASAVPLDLELGGRERVLVISGPNAGGKTVALKTVGICVLLLQSGVHPPCRPESQFPLFQAIFADIGDEQSIASSLSTFTSHLRYLNRMCREASAGSLCLIDEIGDGTDPEEGIALAIGTLEKLEARGALVVATTHYGRLKAYCLERDGFANASMLFDEDGKRPLYRLVSGLVGGSRGIDTARAVGFDPDVVARAAELVGRDVCRLERILNELERQRLLVEEERAWLSRSAEGLKKLIGEYQEKNRRLGDMLRGHAREARREMEDVIEKARGEIERIVKELREGGAGKEQIKVARSALERLRGEIPDIPPVRKASNVEVGDRVSLAPSGAMVGEVVELERDTATVAIGGKRVKIKVWDLYQPSPEEPARREPLSFDIEVESIRSLSLDVRGLRREEALAEVDRFIDRAVLNGVGEVEIIHGIGEGILMKVVREKLRGDPRVKVLKESPGGRAGVSVVELN